MQTKRQKQNEAICLLYSACVEALFAMDQEGANSDLKHPLRYAWEKCREAEKIAVESGLLMLSSAE